MVDYLQHGAIEFRQCDYLDELVHGEVLHEIAHEAPLAAQGTRQEGLSAAGLAVDEDVLRRIPEYEQGRKDYSDLFKKGLTAMANPFDTTQELQM